MAITDSFTRPVQDAQQVLRRFRQEVYDCFCLWPDALFEVVDGQSCPVEVKGLAYLSLAAGARRGHGSLYAAIGEGEIDAGMLRDVLARFRPGWEPTFAIDVAIWARPAADCSPERGYHQYAHGQAHIVAGRPIVAGWAYSWLVGLSGAADSWVAPLDVARVGLDTTGSDVAVGQIRSLLPRLDDDGRGLVALFVHDAGYDPVVLSTELAGQPVQILVRLRNDRVMHTRPDPPPADRRGRPGRPRRHGRRFHFRYPDSQHSPDAIADAHDPAYGHIHAEAWHHLHPERQTHYRDPDGRPAIVEATIIRLSVDKLPGQRNRNRPPGPIWLWWTGPADSFDLHRIWQAYLRRFDIEHFIRFTRQQLGWGTLALRNPAQADRFSDITATTMTQLRLARPLTADHRLPWQPPMTNQQMTPGRVRQGFAHLLSKIDTPVRWPKPFKPGPGRPTGRTNTPAPRHEPTRKTNVKTPTERNRP